MLNIQDNKISSAWPPRPFIPNQIKDKIKFTLPTTFEQYQTGAGPYGCEGSMCKAPETVHVSPVVDTFSGGTNSSTYSTEIHGSTYIQVSVTTSIPFLFLMILSFFGLVYFHKSLKHQITSLDTAVNSISSDKPKTFNQV